MRDTPLEELWQAISEGLARPIHLWTTVVVALAIVGGVLIARGVRARIDRRARDMVAQAKREDSAEAPAPGGSSHVERAQAELSRFSIDGLRRLIFPLSVQALLWGGEMALRVSGVLTRTADARLLRLAMTLFAAMALIRLGVYLLRRVLGHVIALAGWERLLAGAIWLVFALHATGLLEDVTLWLEATAVPLGKAKVSLWAILMAAISIGLTLLAALWAGTVIEARLMRAETLDRNVRAIVSRVVRAVLVLVAVLVALSLAGIDLTVLSVFGGALGVGLGLGLQRIASNYVSGLIILLDRSLAIGDQITVDKYTGAVTEINTRYTVVRAIDGVEAIVPNEMLISTPVTNQTDPDRRLRVALKLTVSATTDPDQALGLMQAAARADARVLSEPAPAAFLNGFPADGLELELVFWMHDLPVGRQAVQSDVARALLAQFRAAGIELSSAEREARLARGLAAPTATGRPS
jgi:small-conductance mechanosensitive channel